MSPTKNRPPIPKSISARVLFLSDRTCCVCRNASNRGIQIHHLDGDPSNNDISNLAVLCFECHEQTQVKGGFGRKLDADQIVLFRDDWLRNVARTRVEEAARRPPESTDTRHEVEAVTSIAEIYREAEQWSSLAYHYHYAGNRELRDKYIEKALRGAPSRSLQVAMRTLQGRLDLLDEEIIRDYLDYLAEMGVWMDHARFLVALGRWQDATRSYFRSITEDLDEGRTFSAAFYLREIKRLGIAEEIYKIALDEAAAEGDLWWQVRAMEDLGWDSEVKQFLLRHADEIRSGIETTTRYYPSVELSLKLKLAEAEGDMTAALELRKEIARQRNEPIAGEEADGAEEVKGREGKTG